MITPLPLIKGNTPASASGLSIGSPTAPVTITEFTDFECPFCMRFHNSTFPILKMDYIDSGKVRFVLRNYPLSFHPYANEAANAVLCMQDQSSELAWKYIGVLFQKQEGGDTINKTQIRRMAKNLKNVRGVMFDVCMDGHVHQDVIGNDIVAGDNAGVMGTPTFYITGPNGQSETILGAEVYEKFQNAIDAMLK
jgi:protein-disulfide isomerase